MCTHRVNFYLQYTIYNLLYLISSSEEHHTFCFFLFLILNSGTQSNSPGSRYVTCAPTFKSPSQRQYCMQINNTFFQLDQRESSKSKNISNGHTYFGILDPWTQLTEIQLGVCMPYILYRFWLKHANANSLMSYLFRYTVRLWWIPSGTHKEN